MKSYKDFEKINIGGSDIASLIIRSCGQLAELCFNEDGVYRAYECFGDDVEIGEHYDKVFSGETMLAIYDDFGCTYKTYEPRCYTRVDVYRAGNFGCIIHWHSEEVKL